jgi:quercetin dioxygenase-like cupin family protein
MNKKIVKISGGLNVNPMLWALQKNPELWNQHTTRTQDPNSPHHQVDDIWARYAEFEDSMNPGAHDSVWYPGILNKLPVRELIMPLMNFVSGERLGGVLITRIKAGKECKPHHDDGWHARYYDKYAIQIQSAPGQRFCFENEHLEPIPGDVYWFDNQHIHWVTNPTEFDRITMIVCIKPYKGE